MRKAVVLLGSCAAFAACTPLLGLGDLKFEDGGGGAGGTGAGGEAPKPGAPLWSARLGGTSDDGASAILTTGAEVLVAGCLGDAAESGSDAGTGTIMDADGPCTAPAAPFVARFAANGKRTRVDTLPTRGAASATGISNGPDGHVFVSGSFNGQLFAGGSAAITSAAMRLPFVAELGEDAVPKWATAVDVSGYGGLFAATQDGGSPVVAGFFNGSLSGLPAGTGDDAFWARLDANGTFSAGARVEQQLPTDAAYAAAVAVGPGGEVALAGQFTGTLGSAVTAMGDYDGFVALYGPGGKEKWTTIVSGPSTQAVNGVAFGKDGELLIVGTFVGTAAIGKAMLSGTGGSDGFVARLDAKGKPLWIHGLLGPQTEMVRAVAVDADDDIYVAGGASSGAMLSDKTVLNRGGLDGFVAKLGPGGQPKWVTSMGGAADDLVLSLAVGPDAVFIAGNFTGTAEIAGKKLTSAGGVDAFIAAFAR